MKCSGSESSFITDSDSSDCDSGSESSFEEESGSESSFSADSDSSDCDSDPIVTATIKRRRSIHDRNADATKTAIEPCDEVPLKRHTKTASPAHHFGKGEVFVGSCLDECDRDTCEAVLHREGFKLSSDLVISKRHNNVLIVTTETDSSSSSGFKVSKSTNKLWSCLAIGGMIISHTWIHAYV
jgi:hypothetical protein